MTAAARDAVDAQAGANGKMEALRVSLEIVRQLVLGREGVAGSGETKARKLYVARGREQAQRILAVAPGIADAMSGVENQEANAAASQVVADGEAGLAAADDDGVDSFGT
jgi:hypothetical protein